MSKKDEQDWSIIISAKTNLFDWNLKELWQYKDLIYMFIIRDFASVYKQTILGPLWYIIQPLLTTLIYAMVFGGLTQMSTEGQPKMLFYMSGIIFWNYFSTNLLKNSDTFLINSGLFGKVYFPRLTVPIATTISGLLALGFQILVLAVLYVYYFIHGADLKIKYSLFLFPYLMLLICMLSMSLGIIVSSLTIKYRDLKHLVTFGIQLAMWLTPVVYPLSGVTNTKLLTLIKLNPFSAIIETIRYSILGTGSFHWLDILYSTVITLLSLVLGIVLFNKTEKYFIDTI
ncbi:MAG: ABC transporter permease [Saprospiraceae bacterium]